MRLGDVPLAVVRQPDGGVRAFVNICRHRGSTLLTDTSGEGLRSIRCPYHAWTYGLDGCLKVFPGAEPGFDDVAKSRARPDRGAGGRGLRPGVRRRRPGSAPFDVDEVLHGAQDELVDFDIGSYEHVDTREREWAMNWKLVMDTFTEPYHIPWLHKDSIAPYYLFDRWIYDAYGPIQRFIGCRKSVLDEFDKPSEDDWDLLPHATLQYLLVPNAVLTHQIDHLELWRFMPVAPGRTIVRTSVYSPGPPADEKARRYFVKNLDVLLGVTDHEDFPAQEQVQRNMATGLVPQVVYGKMEPALAAYHLAIRAPWKLPRSVVPGTSVVHARRRSFGPWRRT